MADFRKIPPTNSPTMKILSSIVALTAALVFPALAGTINLPKKEPIASITFPETWKVTAAEDNLEAESADEEIYFYVEVIDSDSIEEAMKESIAYLEKEKIMVKKGTQKEKKGAVNGIPVVDISFDGKDKDGPCKVSLTFFVISKGKCLSSIYWASPEGEKAHEKELGAIIKSIKRAEK